VGGGFDKCEAARVDKMVNKSSSVKQTQCCFFRRWWCAMSMTVLLWMNGGEQMGCRLLFLCFVLWPWSGRLCKAFTKQGAHPSLPNCRGADSWDCGRVVPRVDVAEDLGLRGNLWIGRSGRGGVWAWHRGVYRCNQERYPVWSLSPVLGTRTHTERERSDRPPQASDYGSGPEKMRLTLGLGLYQGHSRNGTRRLARAWALPPFPRETFRD
jgi:hypothetical protein